jgi:hypothetical protein
MANGIRFYPERATANVKAWALWPRTDRAENEQAQQWWLGVMRRVLWAVNDVDWNAEEIPEDKYTEIAGAVVDEMVKQAREDKRVLTICELSNVDEETRDAFDDPIGTRLTSSLIEPNTLAEREKAADRLLTLNKLGEIYLEAAACEVARDWCEELVTAWRVANPVNYGEE